MKLAVGGDLTARAQRKAGGKMGKRRATRALSRISAYATVAADPPLHAVWIGNETSSVTLGDDARLRGARATPLQAGQGPGSFTTAAAGGVRVGATFPPRRRGSICIRLSAILELISSGQRRVGPLPALRWVARARFTRGHGGNCTSATPMRRGRHGLDAADRWPVVANGLWPRVQAAQRGPLRPELLRPGDSANGDWHEAMNWAAVDRLPVDLRTREQPFRVLRSPTSRVRRRPGRADIPTGSPRQRRRQRRGGGVRRDA